MDDFDFSIVSPKANQWLVTRVEAFGEGRAEFLRPRGSISGPTKVSIDENGGYLIEMEIHDIESENELPLGFHQLISTDNPIEKDGSITLSYPPSKFNTCVKLEVRTDDGSYIAENFDHYSWTFGFNKQDGFKDKVSFRPLTFEFVTDIKSEPKYWDLPLINFISEFMQKEPSLANHPLRIFPSASIPVGIPEQHRKIAGDIAYQMNWLIVFSFGNALGFIEKLWDYNERIQRIKNREVPGLITAVMVGEVGNNSTEFEKLETWFPFLFIDLLSFATGVEIGCPWIEFRDAQGVLVKRIHKRFGQLLYIQGSAPISEVHHRGIGYLLSKAVENPDKAASYLRTTLRLVTKGGRSNQSIEDKMDFLCRALDALCEHFKLSKQNLLALSNEENRDVVKSIIQQAQDSLVSLIREVETEDDYQQSGYLRTISGRLSNIANQDRKFGLAVVDLLKKFEFSDADIIDAYFLKTPRSDGIKKWSDLISGYRGKVIHAGYFSIREGTHKIEDIWTVVQHLHDILVRILLTVLGYDKNYQPTMMSLPMSEPINWVKPGVTADRLGYSEAVLQYSVFNISKKKVVVPPS